MKKYPNDSEFFKKDKSDFDCFGMFSQKEGRKTPSNIKLSLT